MGRLMEGTNYSQYFRNFEIAAGLAEGHYRGAPFNDGDFYKLIEGACAAFAVTHDEYLERGIERAIGVIAQAQRADGYLHTPVLVRQRNGDTNAVPFQDRNNFEMYNLGHLMTAACVHYRVTGRTNFLAVACKAADFLYTTFHDAPPEVARSSVCPSHYMGIVELYRATGNPRYLELAKKFFELRNGIKDGGDDNQDRIPLRGTDRGGGPCRARQLSVCRRGGFVHGNRRHEFVAATGDNLDQCRHKKNVHHRRLRRALRRGIAGRRERPENHYARPSGLRAQLSTAQHHRLQRNLRQHRQRAVELADVPGHRRGASSWTWWNWRFTTACFPAAAWTGRISFTPIPLRVTDPLPAELRWSRTRVPYVSSFCCPPNLVRTIAESAGYAYGKSDDAIWVNLYGGSTLATELPGGQKIKLTQETDYPWNGRVRIKIEACGKKEFALKLRIPGWAGAIWGAAVVGDPAAAR